MMFKRRLMLLSLITGLVLLVAGTTVYAHGEEETHDSLGYKVETCYVLSSEKEDCYAGLCDEDIDDNVCVEDILGAAVTASGPGIAIEVLNDLDLLSNSDFSVSSDTNSFARYIGAYAYNGIEGDGTLREVFLECKTDFHYGCYYGFFDAAMTGRKLTALETALTICNSSSGESSEERCYNVMGHMFMKSNGHDLNDALPVCNSLPGAGFQPDCWDGIFMEAVNEIAAGGTVEGWSNKEPLSPCTEVDDLYQEACYSNQGKYLRENFGSSGNLSLVANMCNSAPEEYIETCRQAVMGTSGGHHPDSDDADGQMKIEDSSGDHGNDSEPEGQMEKSEDHQGQEQDEEEETEEKSWFRKLIDAIFFFI